VNETSSDRRDLGLTSPPAGWCAERAPIQVVTREIARSHLTPGVWSAVARDVAPDRSHRIARPARPRRSKNWSLHRPDRNCGARGTRPARPARATSVTLTTNARSHTGRPMAVGHSWDKSRDRGTLLA
jgi:hypothetical protein